MRIFMLLAIVCAQAEALADECDNPCPCEMRPDRKSELVAGLVLFSASNALSLLTSLQVPSRPAERLFDFAPVVGAIDAAVRDSTPSHARVSLLFFSGVQIIGIAMMATAWALHLEDKRLAMTRDGVGVRF